MKTSIIGALLAGLAAATLAACDGEAGRNAQRDVAGADRTDSALERTKQNLVEAGEKTQQAVAEAGGKLQPRLAEAGDRITAATGKAAANVRETVDDMRKPKDGASRGTARDDGAGKDTTITVNTAERTSVAGSAIPPETRAKIGDTAITASIKTDFLKDPDLSVLKIDVDTKDGVVTLNGLAESEQARERAGRIAGSVKGVRQVRNHLTVKRA